MFNSQTALSVVKSKLHGRAENFLYPQIIKIMRNYRTEISRERERKMERERNGEIEGDGVSEHTREKANKRERERSPIP